MGSGGRRWEALASGVPCLPLQSGPGPRTTVAAQFCTLGRCLRPAADLTTLGLGTRLSQSCAVSCRPGPRSSGHGCLALCLSIPHLGALPPCWTLASSTQGPPVCTRGPAALRCARPSFCASFSFPSAQAFRPACPPRAPGRLGIPVQTDISRPSCASGECQKPALWTRRDRTSCDLGQIKRGLKEFYFLLRLPLI